MQKWSSAGKREGWRTTLALAAMLALVGCGASGSAESAAPPPFRPRSGPLDPVALVGMWKLTGIGAEAGTVVGLAPGDLTIYRSCGELLASWRADSQGLFVAGISGGTDGCDPRSRVAWLDRAAGYRLGGRGAMLVDAHGESVARLVAAGLPPPDPELFEVTDEVRRSFGTPAALPARLTPAARRDLPGRWVPAGGGSKAFERPYLKIRADGRWSASDGCNGSEGGWVAGPAGTLLATSGISTLIGCDNVPVGGWLSAARRAGFDGATLVLLDQNAEELGRLRRDNDGAGAGAGAGAPPSGN
ncbi:hypothetical protein [Actinoplanes sp. NPDC026623]|uniref:hypothetical protein n=1 Tax=Actinoplanes sp. NPDC026623 TaxID=3155610 RepID=UPI0033D92427